MHRKEKQVKVKVCGITCRRNFKGISNFPIDFIGINLVTRSKRKVTKEKAKKIIASLPRSIKPVLILENENAYKVLESCKPLKVHYIQLHGEESPEYCKELKNKKLKIIKALPANKLTLTKLKSYKGACDYILIDSQNENKMGGTGKIANWKIARKIVLEARKYNLPVFLAGGLNPENIASAIKQVKPYGVDVNSGVESSVGKKDKNKLTNLFLSLNSKVR